MPGLLRVSIEVTVREANGRAVFSYRLTNIGTAALGEFALAVPLGAALRAPSGPPGWLMRYAAAEGLLVWQSVAPATDLAPGQSLAGFRFRAAAQPGPAAFRIRHFADDGHTAFRGGGVTQAPVAPARPYPGDGPPGRERKCIAFVRIAHTGPARHYNCPSDDSEATDDVDPPPRP